MRNGRRVFTAAPQGKVAFRKQASGTLHSEAPRQINGLPVKEVTELLHQFTVWSTQDISEGRSTAKISNTTARQVCGTVHRLASFHEDRLTFTKESIFEFSKDLISKGRRNKYVADQVFNPLMHYHKNCYQVHNLICFSRFWSLKFSWPEAELSNFLSSMKSLTSSLLHSREDRASGKYEHVQSRLGH
jgi:hypothetical protein